MKSKKAAPRSPIRRHFPRNYRIASPNFRAPRWHSNHPANTPQATTRRLPVSPGNIRTAMSAWRLESRALPPGWGPRRVTVHAAGEIVASSVSGAQPNTNAASTSTVPSHGPSTVPVPITPSKPSSTLTASLAATATAAPVVQPPLRVLPPFAGYADNKVCDANRTDPVGAPWQGTTIKDAGPAVSAASTSGYNASVRHAMNGMLLLYGKMSPAEMKTFNALWAPYFNFPTSAAQTYFDRLNPLLDQVAAQIAIMDGAVPRAGEAFTAALLDGVQRSSANTSAANVVFRDLKAQKKKLDDLLARINALGNPPDPLAAECAARARHRKALGGEMDIVALVKEQTDVTVDLYEKLHRVDGGAAKNSDGMLTTWNWDGNAFQISHQYNNKNFNYNDPCSVGGSADRDEISGVLSQDGKSVERVSFKRFEKGCDYRTKKVVGPRLRDAFELVDLPLLSVEINPKARTLITFGVKGAGVSKHFSSPVGGVDYDYHMDEFSTIVFGSGKVPEEEARKAILSIADVVGSTFGNSSSSGATPAKPAESAPAAKTNPETAPAEDSIAEAIADHHALAADYRKSAQRWRDQEANEKDPKLREKLESNAIGDDTSASAEDDKANTLKTGVVVHTRTSWEDRDEQLGMAKDKRLFADFGRENALIAEIPKTGEMLEGIEGVQYREQLQQRIDDAFKSPNPSSKLEEIYKDTREHVVSQGQHEMASAQATVNLWESRVAAAEDVEWAAGTALSLSGLWAPEVAQLGLGYATTTGFVEDGVLGAGKNLARGLSPKADLLISAYEGASAIDPATGQPYGAEGALQGAATSALTNIAFEQIGKTVQRYKANFALARQAAGGSGFLPVAKAGEDPHFKEFDFKSPEERYQADLAAAKSEQETQAVNDKHKIQVQRGQMKQEKQQVLRDAEQRVRNGEDPAAVKADYSKQLGAVDEKFHAQENRNAEHAQVMKELGFDTGMDAMNPDIAPSGGEAKTAESDLDFVPKGDTPSEAYQKGKRYAEAMKNRGHNVYEYGDRWVDTTSDTTIWKPGFNGDLPGSSSFEAEAIFGSLPGSDKFGTRGGVEWTSGKAVPADPRGVVLANMGKAAGAGLGSKRPVDLHVIGKSAQKVLDPAISGIEVDPTLRAQLDALRNHQTPEQAGILTLGATEQQKAKEQQAFLEKVGDLMANAYKAASEKSNANLEKLQSQASTATDPAEAEKMRIQVAAYQSSDRGALDTIGRVAPDLVGKIAAANPPESLKLSHESSSAASATSATEEKTLETTFPANDPAFGDLGTRCKDAVTVLDAKIKEAKPGSDSAKYLLELQVALRAGSTNPAAAVLSVRNLSGRELRQVLSDLGIESKKK